MTKVDLHCTKALIKFLPWSMPHIILIKFLRFPLLGPWNVFDHLIDLFWSYSFGFEHAVGQLINSCRLGISEPHLATLRTGERVYTSAAHPMC